MTTAQQKTLGIAAVTAPEGFSENLHTSALRPSATNQPLETMSLHPTTFNPKAATSFLDALGAEHTFQTFGEGDSKGSRSVMLSGAWCDLSESLTRCNQTQGLFVTVSGTDGTGRKKANITSPRALFLDFDGVEPDPEAMSQLPAPSAIVQSRSGKHLYWFLKPGEALDDLEPALARLIDFTGADPACKDMSRVLRVPGSIHHKTGPWATSLIECRADRRYTVAEVMASVPQVAPVAPKASKAKLTKGDIVKPVATKATKAPGSAEGFYTALRNLPTHEHLAFMLETLEASAEGGRNSLLNAVAYKAYGLVALGFPGDVLTTMLHDAALVSGLESSETLTTIESAFTAAASKGEGLTRTQMVWHSFDELYGSRAIYDVRANDAFLDAMPVILESLRVDYINSTGKDISTDRFKEEFKCWVRHGHSVDPDVAYLDGLPEMTTAEAYQAFEELAAMMGFDPSDSYPTRALLRHRIGRVARTYQPGCSMQWALGLVGKGKCGKTSYFKSYSPIQGLCYDVAAGFAARSANDKDEALKRSRSVNVNFDEIDTLYTAASFQNLKSMISGDSEIVRVPYGTTPETLPYRFTWSFTSNSDTPLKDDGAECRRYVTLKMPNHPDPAIGRKRWAYYTANRDRLNAAAKALYLAGEPWELTDRESDIQRERTEEHTDRSFAYTKAVDGLAVMVDTLYTEGHNPGFHLETLEALFSPANRDLYASEKQDVKRALGECGWVSQRIVRNGIKRSVWAPKAIPVADITKATDMDRNNAAEAMARGR
jgi:Virulence-associated protein E